MHVLKWLLATFVLLVAGQVYADGGPTLQAVEAGYVYRNNYWYDGAGNAYTRVKVYWGNATYYGSCGQCYSYQPYWYWSYTLAYPAVAATTLTTYNTVNYDALEQELTKIVAQRERHQQFLAKMSALGLTYAGQYIQPQLLGGTLGGYNGYMLSSHNNLQLGSFGTNGNTLYGYNAVSDPYSTVDPMLMNQQASAMIKQAGDIFGNNMDKYQTGLQTVVSGRNRVAELQVAGQNAERALRAAMPPEPNVAVQSDTTTTVTPVPAQPVQPIQPQAIQPAQPTYQQRVTTGLTTQQRYAASFCINCHGNDSKNKTTYHVLNHWRLPTIQQKAVVKRLVLPASHADFMPRGGKPLPAQVIQTFLPDEAAARGN